MSSYWAFPISKVLGFIAAINPTITAGNPGVRQKEQIKSAIFSYIFRVFCEGYFVDFNSLKGGCTKSRFLSFFYR